MELHRQGSPHCTRCLSPGVQQEIPSSAHFFLSLRAAHPACSKLTSFHLISSIHTAFQLHFRDSTHSKANFKPPFFPGRHSKGLGLGWQGGVGGGRGILFLTYCVQRPRGRLGTWDSVGSHVGRKLAMSFCSSPSSQLEKATLATSVCCESQPLSRLRQG